MSDRVIRKPVRVEIHGFIGRGVKECYVGEDEHLYFVMSDGSIEDLGRCIGRDGLDGVSVVGAVINEYKHLIITLSDGRTIDAGEVGTGGGGGGGEDKFYAHTQYSAAAEWHITHNLGKYPSVTVKDTHGTWVIGDVTYIDANSLIIKFSVAFNGYAYLN